MFVILVDKFQEFVDSDYSNILHLNACVPTNWYSTKKLKGKVAVSSNKCSYMAFIKLMKRWNTVLRMSQQLFKFT